jgi:hypothetical protein
MATNPETIEEVENEQGDHKAELLRDLKTWKQKARDAEAATAAAKAEAAAWKARYTADLVDRPLMADLDTVAGIPAKYLRDSLEELGVLEYEDDQGVQRPVWKDADGKAVEIANNDALHKHLADLSYKEKFAGLAKMLRGYGRSGSGAGQPPGFVPRETPKEKDKPALKFGLR